MHSVIITSGALCFFWGRENTNGGGPLQKGEDFCYNDIWANYGGLVRELPQNPRTQV